MCKVFRQHSGNLDHDNIGVGIKGADCSHLTEHLLLHCERCETFDDFRDEVITIAKSTQSRGRKKGKDKGKCFRCGDVGLLAKQCSALASKDKSGAPSNVNPDQREQRGVQLVVPHQSSTNRAGVIRGARVER